MPGLFRRISAVTVGAAVVAALSLGAHTQTNGVGERFIASAVNMNRGAAGNIEIVVERWSTDANRDKLIIRSPSSSCA
jgi:hypothetical protein